MSLPAAALRRAKAAYRARLLHEQRDAELHEQVDAIKVELLNFEKGRQKSLSARAINVLAGYALDEGVTPKDVAIRKRAEDTISYWRSEFGVRTELRGPSVDTKQLIALRHRGQLVGGWLWMSGRDAGRSNDLGHHRLSSRAILAAIEVLLPYCQHSPYARGDERGGEREPSLAAQFFFEAIASFECRVSIQNINYVLKTYGPNLRQAHKAIFAPRRQ